ncbi:MAG TPA: YqeG family HAD IIIA-type phosphatase [Thermoanaerobacterales bacterium]|nr:YqeG family HAD IIIA-type phosphatase [Thermoanaerobacterales bacterium]
MLKLFCPNMYVKSIYSINPTDLISRNIKGIIVDLDNTLVPWNVKKPNKKLINWFTSFLNHGIKFCIVSNNNESRVKLFADGLNIPYIYSAIKPSKRSFKKGIVLLGTDSPNTAVIGDQILTDILGGNRVGIFTILVKPMCQQEFWWTKLMRKFEKRIIYSLMKKGLLDIPK